MNIRVQDPAIPDHNTSFALYFVVNFGGCSKSLVSEEWGIKRCFKQSYTWQLLWSLQSSRSRVSAPTIGSISSSLNSQSRISKPLKRYGESKHRQILWVLGLRLVKFLEIIRLIKPEPTSNSVSLSSGWVVFRITSAKFGKMNKEIRFPLLNDSLNAIWMTKRKELPRRYESVCSNVKVNTFRIRPPDRPFHQTLSDSLLDEKSPLTCRYTVVTPG